jgi:hypothetical protein
MWLLAMSIIVSFTAAARQQETILIVDLSMECIVGDREDNFTVGLTNNALSKSSLLTNGYTTCGHWNGGASNGTIFVQCSNNPLAARYVVILGHSDILNICDVEVYAAG